jgi:pyruvate formate lyase activating enzyme
MKDGKPVTDETKCTLCGRCVEVCPTQAREILGKKMTVGEVIKELDNNKRT